MTLAQIEKTREFIEKIDFCNNCQDMKALNKEIKNYYNEKYTAHLYIDGFYSDYNDCIEIDKRSLNSFLQSLLDTISNYHEYNYCIKLIEDGKKAMQDELLRDQYVLHVDEIMQEHSNYFFDLHCSDLKEYYRIYPDKKGQVCNRSESDIQDIIEQIQRYLERIFNNVATSPIDKKADNSTKIDFHPIISAFANANVSVDISVSIEHARQQIEEAGLSDSQHQAVMDKLREIEEIAKSKENKGKRWTKAKEILKWVAEQGIAVAGIVLPLLAPMIG